LDDVNLDELKRWFAELESQGNAAVAEAKLGLRRVVMARSLDMPYVRQEHAVTVDVPLSAFSKGGKTAIRTHFDELHKERYGRGSPEEPGEIVSIRSAVTGVMKHPRLAEIARGGARPAENAFTGERRVFFAGKG